MTNKSFFDALVKEQELNRNPDPLLRKGLEEHVMHISSKIIGKSCRIASMLQTLLNKDSYEEIGVTKITFCKGIDNYSEL